ncbi:MAG: hypothetical protein K9I37_02865 [Crocinitomicaceae bacterium]|nr:hypothetical protein [Crocinitomicaceae bacterium]
MKKIFALILMMLFFAVFDVYSQDLRTKEEKVNDILNKYEELYEGEFYYEIYNTSDKDNSDSRLDSCWRIGYYLVSENGFPDPSVVTRSKMHFSYFPKISLLCEDVTLYDLTNISGLTWQYKDENLTILVKMKSVETFIGYDLTEIRITNTSSESCKGPTTFYKKFN